MRTFQSISSSSCFDIGAWAPKVHRKLTHVPVGAWTLTAYTGGKQLRKDVEIGAGATTVTLE